MSHQFKFCGVKRNYYVYDNELYTSTFPMDWVVDRIPGTGPTECVACARNGSWNGVFVGYCVDCATNQYNSLRGSGFISPGKEQSITHPYSATNGYLSGIEWSDIGDTDFCDSAKIAEYQIHIPDIKKEDEDEYEYEEDQDVEQYIRHLDNYSSPLDIFNTYPWLTQYVFPTTEDKFSRQFTRMMCLIVLLRCQAGLPLCDNAPYLIYMEDTKNNVFIKDNLPLLSVEDKIHLLEPLVTLLQHIILDADISLGESLDEIHEAEKMKHVIAKSITQYKYGGAPP